MHTFTWSQDLAIGIDAMDMEHRKIINYMNALAKAWEAGATVAELDAAFAVLCQYTRKHFADEEKYMEAMQFPKLRTHKLVHAKLLDELDHLYSEFRRTGELTDRVFRFLSFWLKSHISGVDRQYARMVQAA